MRFSIVVERSSVILVAEDDLVVRNLIKTVLARSGYTLLLASDGLEALELSRRYVGVIDLLLSDITMPRLDGVGLLERLRADRPNVKALLISGKTSSGVGQANECFDFLAKPFLPSQLKARIELMLAWDGAGKNVDVL